MSRYRDHSGLVPVTSLRSFILVGASGADPGERHRSREGQHRLADMEGPSVNQGVALFRHILRGMSFEVRFDGESS